MNKTVKTADKFFFSGLTGGILPFMAEKQPLAGILFTSAKYCHMFVTQF